MYFVSKNSSILAQSFLKAKNIYFISCETVTYLIPNFTHSVKVFVWLFQKHKGMIFLVRSELLSFGRDISFKAHTQSICKNFKSALITFGCYLLVPKMFIIHLMPCTPTTKRALGIFLGFHTSQLLPLNLEIFPPKSTNDWHLFYLYKLVDHDVLKNVLLEGKEMSSTI